MIQITRRLEFDAGHRVYGHEGKCASVHGHRYVVELTCYAADLDELGRVIDFSVLKSVVGKWIDDNLDHGMLLWSKDPLCDLWRLFGNDQLRQVVAQHSVSDKVFDMSRQKHFIMDSNPTAENIAELICVKAQELLDEHGIRVSEVVVHETPNCKAVYHP